MSIVTCVLALSPSPVVQLVERVAVNHHVAGSSPARGASRISSVGRAADL